MCGVRSDVVVRAQQVIVAQQAGRPLAPAPGVVCAARSHMYARWLLDLHALKFTAFQAEEGEREDLQGAGEAAGEQANSGVEQEGGRGGGRSCGGMADGIEEGEQVAGLVNKRQLCDLSERRQHLRGEGEAANAARSAAAGLQGQQANAAVEYLMDLVQQLSMLHAQEEQK